MFAPDPHDPELPSAYDHDAFYSGVEDVGETVERDGKVYGPCLVSPTWLESDEDTGLRCACGREVVGVMDPTETKHGWAHVGIGDASDHTGMLRVA